MTCSPARSLRELVGGPKILQHYIPDFAVELLDLSTVADDELPRQSLTRATLLLLKCIFRAELRAHLEEIFRSAALQRGDDELQEILRSFLTYVAAAARQIEMRDLGPVVAKSLDTKGERAMTSILEEWIEKGRVEGLEKGRVEGLEEGRVQAMRSGISDILTVRFPDDAAALGARINCLDSAELLRDVHRLSLTAVSATEISDWLASHG